MRATPEVKFRVLELRSKQHIEMLIYYTQFHDRVAHNKGERPLAIPSWASDSDFYAKSVRSYLKSSKKLLRERINFSNSSDRAKATFEAFRCPH